MDAGPVDLETGLRGGDMQTRLWLRLLTCGTLIEGELRRRLQARFATTLPRFDLMAQLHRAPGGLPLGEVSKRMMVSNGNVTGLVDRLAQEGLVERNVDPADRRSARVRLTGDGERAFAEMAVEHRAWIAELFSGLPPETLDRLWSDLGALKASVRAATDGREGTR